MSPQPYIPDWPSNQFHDITGWGSKNASLASSFSFAEASKDSHAMLKMQERFRTGREPSKTKRISAYQAQAA